ncbi:MAG: cache domain-containing protein [Cyanobacteriota bacterium]|nr:cache domain-containing protein [Cyanobacteriota bacterium]
MNQDVEKMSVAMEAIIRDPLLRNSFRDRDQDALLQRARPLFERLKKRSDVTHFYFHLPNRTNLVRVHKALKGDLIERETIKRAQASGQPSAGLEQGPTGNLVLRVVYPWHSDFPERRDSRLFIPPWKSELIGYLELGIEFEDIAERVHNILNVDLILAVDKELLDRIRWENRNKRLGKQSDWNELPETVIVDKTIETIPEPIVEVIIQSQVNPNRQLQFSENGRFSEAIFLPLLDMNGQYLGNVVVIKDISDIRNQARESILITSLICTCIGIILVILFYILLGRVEKRIIEK